MMNDKSVERKSIFHRQMGHITSIMKNKTLRNIVGNFIDNRNNNEQNTIILESEFKEIEFNPKLTFGTKLFGDKFYNLNNCVRYIILCFLIVPIFISLLSLHLVISMDVSLIIFLCIPSLIYIFMILEYEIFFRLIQSPNAIFLILNMFTLCYQLHSMLDHFKTFSIVWGFCCLWSIFSDALPINKRIIIGLISYISFIIITLGLMFGLATNNIQHHNIVTKYNTFTFNSLSIVMSCCLNIMFFWFKCIYSIIKHPHRTVLLRSALVVNNVDKVMLGLRQNLNKEIRRKSVIIPFSESDN